MTPEEKFSGVEAEALGHLSRALSALDPVPLSRASVVVLIWRYPSFEPCRSWSLIQGRDAYEKAWLVRRVTWDRPTDNERAANPLKQTAFMTDPDPKPTIAVLDARANGKFASSFLARLGNLSVRSLLPSEGVVLDGVANGLETRGGKLHIE